MSGFLEYWACGFPLVAAFWLLVHAAHRCDPRPGEDWDCVGAWIENRRIPLTWVVAPLAWAAMAIPAGVVSPEAGLIAIWLIARCIRPTDWWIARLPTKQELREARLAKSEAEYRAAFYGGE